MGKIVLCPRCKVNSYVPYGENGASDEVPYPALSRAADVYVCNWCGIHESFQDLAGIPLPLPEEWPVLLPVIDEIIPAERVQAG